MYISSYIIAVIFVNIIHSKHVNHLHSTGVNIKQLEWPLQKGDYSTDGIAKLT